MSAEKYKGIFGGAGLEGESISKMRQPDGITGKETPTTIEGYLWNIIKDLGSALKQNVLSLLGKQ